MLGARRAALPYLLVIVFACQIGANASAWVFLSGTSDADECTCLGHTPGLMCPMHHGKTSRPASDCRLTGTDQSSTDFWSFSSIGVMPEEVSSDVPVVREPALESLRAIPIQRSDIPEPPPPRTLQHS